MVSNSNEIELACWMLLFSSSHIGMSAIRTNLIEKCGRFAASLGIIGTGQTLPSYWPGDEVGGQEVFPDEETTGRQLYRAGYTVVSFTTLGGAFSAYLSAIKTQHQGIDFDLHSIINFVSLTRWSTLFQHHNDDGIIWMVMAASSFGISIASLFNPSPLSLVPGFQLSQKQTTQQQPKQQQQEETGVTLPLGLQRSDAIKLEPRGLTRITRHPLILPVVTWGIATSVLSGGHAADALLFGGLALYAIAGCAAQDLRVLREEGSVGTVFRPAREENNNDASPLISPSSSSIFPSLTTGTSSSSTVLRKTTTSAGTTSSSSSLQTFFQSTSFIPFRAMIDGRQPTEKVLAEFPLAPFLVGCIIGYALELQILAFLSSYHG